MIYLIFLMLLVWVAFVLFRTKNKPNYSKHSDSNKGNKMVACSVCDTHIPESEAIIEDGKIYCSKDCL